MPVALGIGAQVGIEQDQADMADAGVPELDFERPARQLDVDADLGSVGIEHRRHRQVVEIRVLVDGLLVTLAVDLLLKVSLAVEQPHADERQTQVAGGLAMVAGEYAQSSRIDRQAFVEAEFRAKIGNQVVFAEHRRVTVAPSVRQVSVVRRQHALVAGEKTRVRGGFRQPALVDTLEQHLGAVAYAVPKRAVQTREQLPRGSIPAVPKVV